LFNIKNNRGIINHQNIINLLNKNTQICVIPHYTFHSYFYNNNIPEIIDKIDFNIPLHDIKSKICDIIKNTIFDKNEVLNALNNDLEKIKELDSYSDIKMYNFVLNNYKKIKIFENHSHPKEYFYFIMVEKILKKLNIPIQNIKTHNRCSDSYYPIHPEVKNFRFRF
jgi:hypothetical protein